MASLNSLSFMVNPTSSTARTKQLKLQANNYSFCPLRSCCIGFLASNPTRHSTVTLWSLQELEETYKAICEDSRTTKAVNFVTDKKSVAALYTFIKLLKGFGKAWVIFWGVVAMIAAFTSWIANRAFALVKLIGGGNKDDAAKEVDAKGETAKEKGSGGNGKGAEAAREEVLRFEVVVRHIRPT